VQASETKVLSPNSNSTTGTGFLGERADEYTRAYARETPGGFALRVRQRRVLELFDKAGGKVLDVGCGPAEVVQPLLSLGCQFWGVDPSPKRPNPKWTNRWPWRFSICQFRWERYQLVF
jgi:SAM-dependent methyltransferase